MEVYVGLVIIGLALSDGYALNCAHVCYEDTVATCLTDCPPFYALPLPWFSSQLGTVLTAYDRNTANTGTVLDITSDHNSWTKRFKTYILIHGYNSSTDVWVDNAKNTILANADINVITVDWQRGASGPYSQAVSNARVVGQQIARTLLGLQRHQGLHLGTVTIVGHSLGAHVAGFAGEALGGNVGRITGLDPAGPLFQGEGRLRKLDATDGHFVEIIHTNDYFLGNSDIVGHVDYLPNGGSTQPGCEWLPETTCDHQRAWRMFIASITAPCNYRVVDCRNRIETGRIVNIGFNEDSSARGRICFRTSRFSPYC